MNTTLTDNDRVLFFGDSITETGRSWQDDSALGNGFVAKVAWTLMEQLPGVGCLNRGVSGDGVLDLARRFQQDCLDRNPTVVSIMVGVNDIWMGMELGIGATVARYEIELDAILTGLVKVGIRPVIMEPFLVAADNYLFTYRQELLEQIHVVHKLATEHSATLVPTDALMNAHRNTTEDGVHPTDLGHRLLAAAWLDAMGIDAVENPALRLP